MKGNFRTLRVLVINRRRSFTLNTEVTISTKPEPAPFLNKSLVTNLLASGLIIAGYTADAYNEQLLNTGFYALSGAITNWLAIHMLFEKVPGLYGSGIIPNRFEDFKAGIKNMMMDQFFTAENIERFLNAEASEHLDFSRILDAVNYDLLFEKLVQAIEKTPMAPMLAMMGGSKALEPMKPSITEKMKEALNELTQSQQFQDAVHQGISSEISGESIKNKVDTIVFQRLEELTPEMVKTIIQNMIRQHLGWLVVWGGVFGGIIGLLASFIS